MGQSVARIVGEQGEQEGLRIMATTDEPPTGLATPHSQRTSPPDAAVCVTHETSMMDFMVEASEVKLGRKPSKEQVVPKKNGLSEAE